jgi:DNA-binding SARP family transcriptional activator
MTPPWHLRIFGIPELQDADGSPLLFRTKKQLALLVYLALEAQQRPVSRELLVELLWDDVIQERGRHSLSQGLSVIRQHLGKDAATRRPGVVRLTCQLPTDLDRIAAEGVLPPEFAQPLRELDDTGSHAFAHWLDATRASCLKAARRLLSDQLESARSSGNLRRVHERAAELYRVDPYSDAAVHVLAEQSLLDGDSAGAIKLLRTHLDRTAEELRCNPHPDVERLLRRIEKGIVKVERQKATSLNNDFPQQAEIFVGREQELSHLEALWEDARSGSLKTCLITGPAGIGKSTLIRQFATSVASRAWLVWQVSCQEIGVNIPFAAVSELIHVLLREPSVSGTDPQWLAEVSRVTPSLRTAYPGVPEPPPAAPESVRIRVAEALAQMMDAAADGGPFLLIFDDLQQMDPASRDVMRVLMRRIEPRPVLLLTVQRTTDEYDRLHTHVEADELRSEIEMSVRPLATPVALGIVDALCGDLSASDPGLRTTIAEFALGNPYLIEMLASDWQRQGRHSLVAAYARGEYNAAHWRPPQTMRSAFKRQYQALTGDAERLLELLAVARRSMQQTEVTALMGEPPHAADKAVLELIGRGILRVDGSGLGFKNDLHRAFVYYAMSDERRTYHHVRLARLLCQEHDTADFQRDLEASSHFLSAGMIAEAATTVDRGAEAAIAQGAANEVEHTLTRLIDTDAAPQPDRLKLLLATSLVAQGKYRSAYETLQQINDANVEQERDQVALHALRAKSLQLGALTDARSALAAARVASAAASAHGTEADQVGAYQTMAEGAYESGDLELLADVKLKVAKLAAVSEDGRVRRLAGMTAGYCMLVSGEWREAIGFFGSSLRAADGEVADPEQVRVINGLGAALAAVGRHRAAVAAYRRAWELSLRTGNSQTAIMALSNLGVLYDDLGAYSSAATMYRDALQLADGAAAPRRMVDLYRNVAGLAICLGDLAEASQYIQLAMEQARSSGHMRLEASVYLMEANHHLAGADPDVAWSLLNEAERLLEPRSTVLDPLNMYWLVKGYCLWSRYGVEALHRMLDEHGRLISRAQLPHRLSIELLTEAIDAVEGREPQQGRSPMQVVHDRSMYGVVAGVVAIGVVPHGLPQPRPGESPARFASRVFPTPEGECMPLSVSGAESLASRS